MSLTSKPKPEPTVTGESLYAATRAVEQAFGDIFSPKHVPTWEELTWQEQDRYEAQADELNEARRGTP